MAKSNKTQADTAPSTGEAIGEGAAAFDVAKLMDSNGENLKAMMRANEAILEGLAELGREMIAFSNTRFRQDMAASESLMGCRDAGEAFKVQMDFVRTASEQYYTEANKLVELASKMTKECWSPLENRTQANLRSMNKSD